MKNRRKPDPVSPKRLTPNEPSPIEFEAEVAEGLEQIAADEVRRKLGARLHGTVEILPLALRFRYVGHWERLRALRTVQTVYQLERFAVPRPRALLSNEYLPIIVGNVQKAAAEAPVGSFRSFDIHAAGSDSSIMRRIREEIQSRTALTFIEDGGDLILRIRPVREQGAGWEVLTRITPRPLATRDWRVCNLEGALNAAVAHAMNLMTRPTPEQIYVNLGCGSGTFLIERLAYGPAKVIIGLDNSEAALDCARQNIAAARAQAIRLIQARVGDLPLPNACADALTADLPFGQAVGSHAQNQALYPIWLAEAARIARAGAIFAAITHEVRLMDAVLENQSAWIVQRVIRTTLRGLHPRLYVLERAAAN